MIFGGNTWDWILIFLLIVMAIGAGFKNEEGENVIPKELLIRTSGVLFIIVVIFNLPKIIGFFL